MTLVRKIRELSVAEFNGGHRLAIADKRIRLLLELYIDGYE